MFETWSDENLNKYDINVAEYDHTNVKERPPVFIDWYVKTKKYLKVIFLWDEKIHFMVSSKYEPLVIGHGEAGIRNSATELSSPTRSPTSKRSSRGSNTGSKGSVDFADMVSSVVTNVMD